MLAGGNLYLAPRLRHSGPFRPWQHVAAPELHMRCVLDGIDEVFESHMHVVAYASGADMPADLGGQRESGAEIVDGKHAWAIGAFLGTEDGHALPTIFCSSRDIVIRFGAMPIVQQGREQRSRRGDSA